MPLMVPDALRASVGPGVAALEAGVLVMLPNGRL